MNVVDVRPQGSHGAASSMAFTAVTTSSAVHHAVFINTQAIVVMANCSSDTHMTHLSLKPVTHTVTNAMMHELHRATRPLENAHVVPDFTTVDELVPRTAPVTVISHAHKTRQSPLIDR